jgi:hypothetical protein
VLKTNFLEDRDMNLPNTQAAMSDAADLIGTVIGTFESGKGLFSEITGIVTSSQVRSDVAGLMTTVPEAAAEITAAAKGGVFTIAADAPEFLADAAAFYTQLLTAIAASKGVQVVVTPVAK